MMQRCNGIGNRLLFLFLRAVQGQPAPTIKRGVATRGGATSRDCSKKSAEVLTVRRVFGVTY